MLATLLERGMTEGEKERRFRGTRLRGEGNKRTGETGVRFTERERRDLGFATENSSCSQNSLVIRVTIAIEGK
jgi:hypothetical protein